MPVHVLKRAGVKNLDEKFFKQKICFEKYLKAQLVVHKAIDFGLIKIINLQLDSETCFGVVL